MNIKMWIKNVGYSILQLCSEIKMGKEPYLDDYDQAKLFFDFLIKHNDGKLLLTGNLKQADVARLNIQDSFTKEVIEIWSDV